MNTALHNRQKIFISLVVALVIAVTGVLLLLWQNNQQKNTLAKIEEKASALNTQLEKISGELTQLQINFNQLGDDHQQLNNSYKTLNDKYQEQSTKYKDLDKAHLEAQTLIQSLTQEKEALQKQIKELEDTLKNLTDPEASSPDESGAVPTLYLTFDDGPSEVTNQILDILKTLNIKATFFIIGKGDTAVYQRIVDEGHTIALHSFSHEYKKIYTSAEAFFQDLYQIQEQINATIGVKPMHFRFAGGSSNSHVSAAVLRQIIDRAKAEGFIYHDWNIDSGDANAITVDLETIVAKSTAFADQSNPNHPKLVNLLMHDSKNKTTTAEALSQIIQLYLDNGFQILPISNNTIPVQHRK